MAFLKLLVLLPKGNSLLPLEQLPPKAKGNLNSSHKALANSLGNQIASDSGVELSVVLRVSPVKRPQAGPHEESKAPCARRFAILRLSRASLDRSSSPPVERTGHFPA
jgi:hypothetical protein